MKKLLMLFLLGFCSLQINAWAQDCPPADPNCTSGGNDDPQVITDPPVVVVPEPSILWLMAAGIAGVGVSRLAKKRKN